MQLTSNTNWPTVGGEVVFRDGSRGTYLGLCPLGGGKHRVEDGKTHPTVWRLDNDGAARGDKAESYRDAEWRAPALIGEEA